MSGINKAIIIGRLGLDPEAISFQNGSMITKLSVATSQKWRNKIGECQQHTEWHKIVIHGKMADFAMINLKKGSLILIEGTIRHRQYQDSHQRRYITEIHAEFIQPLGEFCPINAINAP